ncbi:MAG: hypothetical protein HC888_12215 [Candidatus Competibacteraceae bacterium]|nr:hypothetical protein [Candidatus Competibacteraceae bacterium]
MNAFDELLSKISAEEDRNALKSLGEKIPELRDGVLRQADYSRKMDEFRSKEQQLQQWNQWANDNWDPNAKMTKAEAIQLAEIQRLQDLVNSGGDSLDQEQLDRALESYARSKGVVTQDVLDAKLKAKEEEFTNRLTEVNARAAAFTSGVLPMTVKHFQEFGEVLDTNKMFEQAQKEGVTDLGHAYDRFVAPRREERQKAEFDRQLAEAKEAGKQEALQAIGGRNPIDDGAPEMGIYQQKAMGMVKEDAASRVVPDTIDPKNHEAIGAWVAEQMVKDQMSRHQK